VVDYLITRKKGPGSSVPCTRPFEEQVQLLTNKGDRDHQLLGAGDPRKPT